ncbi:YwhD family protein [Bacillus sp. H-16]|uniref:YwhD family protein n=1 Tax=Alteribacter salitolerans TaxID=2912333 RepID=UPI001964E73F|nr:YwhD family protein [Alteribacter salitolerans]MBM7095536.1 YwhD family protein [Alteribacter salitolerans]
MNNLFDDNKGKKRGQGFNILSSDSTDGHGGYGSGVLNLNNMSPVFIDVQEGEAFVDMGALHARSSVEKGIKFLREKDQVPNGKPYWLVWVTVEDKGDGPFYHGVTACELTVNREIRRGYKSLPEHVNNMDRSLKGRVIISHMDEKSKSVLAGFLEGHNKEVWDRSPDSLKEGLRAE